MKKKILMISVVALALSIVTGGTLAYFTAEDTARNVITSGAVEIKLVEQQLVDGVLQPYPSQPIPVMPGTTVSKIVSIQNLEEPAWIRVSYSLSVYDADGNKKDIPADELAKVVLIEPDSENWTEKDGWWYYNAAALPGETTKPLFETVSFSGIHMGNEYQSCTLLIDVNAQAVQKVNNGDTVLEAAGWPEN